MTTSATKPKRTRNPASTITVGRAFDTIRARVSTASAREKEIVHAFKLEEAAWVDKQMARVPAESRGQLATMLNAAAVDDGNEDGTEADDEAPESE